MISEVYNTCFSVQFAKFDDNFLNVIICDPPYLYLKNQPLDIEFNEELYFKECYRTLKDDGFLIMFGRGTSFYRWNTICAGLGFNFKEEIIWNKTSGSTPNLALQRVHETVSIHTKKNGIINKCKVPYVEERKVNIRGLNYAINDIKDIMKVLGNEKLFIELKEYLESGKRTYLEGKQKHKNRITISIPINERSRKIITAITVLEGFQEQSIISINRNHYDNIHATEKPIELMQRLLALCLKKDVPNNVFDPFLGSGNSRIAAKNLGCNFWGTEINKDFFDIHNKFHNNQHTTLF